MIENIEINEADLLFIIRTLETADLNLALNLSDTMINKPEIMLGREMTRKLILKLKNAIDSGNTEE